MNPTTIAPSAPAPAPVVPAPPAAPTDTLTPNIVNNIPLRNPDAPRAAPTAAPINEDDELDQIMQDVGKDLKTVGQRKPKKHFWQLGHKAKPVKPKPSVVPQSPPAPTMAVQSPSTQPPIAPQPQPIQPVQSPAQTATSKPQKTSSLPLVPLLIATGVTALLMAASISAFK